jgi:hypothetical protein
MAYILDIATNRILPLAAHHTFGRLAASVDTCIDKPYVSKLHAAIEWNGYHWRVKHLGLNGTWVNGVAIPQGESRELALNDLINIAEQKDPGFLIRDLSPPADMLWPLNIAEDQAKPIELVRYHLLPDNQTPEIAIYFDDADQQWYLEAINSEHQRQQLLQGDMVEFNNSQWQFIHALVYGPTEARAQLTLPLDDFHFVFNMSLDEETTQLELKHPSQQIDLAVRTHHYLLLQLARHRAEDALQGLDSKSQGWVYAEQLAAELGLDSTHMNIQIFRARKQLADLLPGARDQQFLLERRGGKIRFGCDKFTIYKGDKLTLCSPFAANKSES